MVDPGLNKYPYLMISHLYAESVSASIFHPEYKVQVHMTNKDNMNKVKAAIHAQFKVVRLYASRTTIYYTDVISLEPSASHKQR